MLWTVVAILLILILLPIAIRSIPSLWASVRWVVSGVALLALALIALVVVPSMLRGAWIAIAELGSADGAAALVLVAAAGGALFAAARFLNVDSEN